MFLNRAEIFCVAMDRHALQRLSVHHVQRIRQANNVIEMRVGEKDIERRRFEPGTSSKHSSSSVENQTGLRNHETRRMARLARVITAVSKQMQSHSVPRFHSCILTCGWVVRDSSVV